MKPTSEHQRVGTYRADRHGNRLEGKLPPGSPTMPEHLSADAREAWQTITTNLPENTLAKIDSLAFEMACQWFGEWRRCQKELQASGDNGYRLTIQLATASKNFWLIAGRFGCSPIDRAKLKTSTPPVDEYDPFEVLRQISQGKV